MDKDLENELIQMIRGLSTQTHKASNSIKEFKEQLETNNESLLKKNSPILKAFQEELVSIHEKNNEQDEVLGSLLDGQVRLLDQLNKNYDVVKQVSLYDVQGRLSILEGKLAERKAAIDFFASVPRPLQYLFIVSISLASIAWTINLLR